VSGALEVDITLRRDGFRLEVGLVLEPGVSAVVGPNGAGKTTLLRAIAGLVPAASGTIRLAGRVLHDTERGVRVPVEGRRVAVVHQEHLLFPHLDVTENVAFGPRARGVRTREARRIADGWIERMGLTARRGARPSELSGGEAQRVALARALATEPDALLMDEPLAGLDVRTRHGVRRVLRDHLATFDGPVVLVTHDPVDAATLAGHLVVLEDGVVTQQGTVGSITRHPRSVWAARLAGVNLHRGWARDGRIALRDGAELVAIDVPEGDVFAAIPPAAVALYRGRPDGTPRNVWHGTVTGFDTFGDRVRVHVDGPVPLTAEVTHGATAALDLAAGGEVWVAVKAAEVRAYPV
jgi:molybdate transport system ATP-binding protein